MMRFFKLDPRSVFVIHDEVDFPLGVIKLRAVSYTHLESRSETEEAMKATFQEPWSSVPQP